MNSIDPAQLNRLNQDYLDYYRGYVDEKNPDIYETETSKINQKKGVGELFSDTVQFGSDHYLNELQDLTKIEKEKAYAYREKDYQTFTTAIGDFLSEIEEARKETRMTIEQIINEMYKIESDIRSESAEIAQEQVKEDQKEVRKLSQERLEKLRESLEKAKATKFWGRFEKAVDITLSLLGMGTTVAAMVGTGGTAAVVVALIGLTNNLDSIIFDDAIKKTIISAGAWAVPVNEEKKKAGKEMALVGLKLALTITSLFAAYKFIPSVASNIKNTVKPVLEGMETVGTGLQLTTQGMQMKNQYQMGQIEGQMSDAAFNSKKKMDKVKASIRGIESLFKQSLEEWEARRNTLEKSKEVLREILSH